MKYPFMSGQAKDEDKSFVDKRLILMVSIGDSSNLEDGDSI